MPMIATEAVNTIPTKTGRIRIVCQICGRVSGPVDSARLSDIPDGWWVAPYPESAQHSDGSFGDLFTCPTCHARRDFPISPREYMPQQGTAPAATDTARAAQEGRTDMSSIPVVTDRRDELGGYRIESITGEPHFIDFVEEGSWKVWPASTDGRVTHLSADEAREYIRELQSAVDEVERLNALGAPLFAVQADGSRVRVPHAHVRTVEPSAGDPEPFLGAR